MVERGNGTKPEAKVTEEVQRKMKGGRIGERGVLKVLARGVSLCQQLKPQKLLPMV